MKILTLPSPVNKHLQTWLKTKRIEKGLTLRDLSALTGKHFSIYGKIETGKRNITVIEYLELCKALDADPVEGIALITKKLN